MITLINLINFSTNFFAFFLFQHKKFLINHKKKCNRLHNDTAGKDENAEINEMLLACCYLA